MEALIVRATPDKLKAVKRILKALNIDFEKTTSYSAEFEAKMKRSDEDKKAGRFRVIKTKDMWK